MYIDNDNKNGHLQDLAHLNLLRSPHEDYGNKQDKTHPGSIDPLTERVWEVVTSLLDETDRVTIRDICERVPAGESAVRDRLNILVDQGKLKCLPGSGRRPSFYYPSDKEFEDPLNETSTPSAETASLTDEDLLECIRQKESTLLEQLDKLQRDREAIERVIELRRNFSNNK